MMGFSGQRRARPHGQRIKNRFFPFGAPESFFFSKIRSTSRQRGEGISDALAVLAAGDWVDQQTKIW